MMPLEAVCNFNVNGGGNAGFVAVSHNSNWSGMLEGVVGWGWRGRKYALATVL